VRIRPIGPSEISRLVDLIADHASYEEAAFSPSGVGDRLADAIFGPSPRLRCLVAVGPDDVVGYCSFTMDFSTWQAAEYIHMDTLFVDAAWRGQGVGERLLRAAAKIGQHAGATQMQWQTPDWNSDAIRFYARLGATHLAKTRFTLPLYIRAPASERGSIVKIGRNACDWRDWELQFVVPSSPAKRILPVS
jgi:GNAT superfamily N-acetyltransferase